MKHLLIISNNVLSENNNNGKTILSFFSGVENITVAQLYLSGEQPRVAGCDYFQISDKDIIRGLFCKSKRGGQVKANHNGISIDDFSIRNKVGRNDFTLFIRDILWKNKWNSRQLEKWLNQVNPDAIFFVGGYALFAYQISTYIQRRFNSRLTVYITDDYIMPRKKESLLHRIRRKMIKSAIDKILGISSCFYTVSAAMHDAYLKEFKRDSYLAVNMTDDLKKDTEIKRDNEIILTYTGSFYYGRDDVLEILAKAILKYNSLKKGKRAKLIIYSNVMPDENEGKKICVEEASEYGGALNQAELIEQLNLSDMLVFVESFDADQVEKTRYSLSTKVTEYMSVGKPILAIGPKEVGSMQYLDDVAMCINKKNLVSCELERFLLDVNLQDELACKARNKYLQNHNKLNIQKKFLNNIFGNMPPQ